MLLTEDMVDVMGPGSVVVDLAAEQGGNCALTISGESRLLQWRDYYWDGKRLALHADAR